MLNDSNLLGCSLHYLPPFYTIFVTCACYMHVATLLQEWLRISTYCTYVPRQLHAKCKPPGFSGAACSQPRTSVTSNGLWGHGGWDRVTMHKVEGDDRWFVVNICRSSRFIFGQIKLKIHQKIKLFLLQFELWKHNWFISCH